MENKYINRILKNLNHTYYAHTKASGPKELLASHLELTFEYYRRMEKDKGLENIIKNMIKEACNCDEELVSIIYELFKQAIYYHDIGKINPLFQRNKMDHNLNIQVENTDDSHAALSARIYIDSIISFTQENFNDEKDKEKRLLVLYIGYYFGYIISRHHTRLETLINLLESIKNKEIPEIPVPQKEFYENQLNQEIMHKFIKRLSIHPIEMYILCKTLYSCMITSDFYDTYDYMYDQKIQFEVEKEKALFQMYTESELIKNIRRYQNKQIKLEGINKLRSDMFLETEENLMRNLDKNIFYLEAPTGAGKTNMAINLAKELYEKNKDITSIHYIFPFNNIIEQTDKTFQNYFRKYKDYVVINSISSMASDEKENLDYERVYTKTIFNQYPMIITSHINLFATLFGTRKEGNYSLYNYINSVVILDEIQAYSNGIWREMIEMLDKYAKLLNIKFIIMSATLPRLDTLLEKKISSFCSLINDVKEYYENGCFKNRVILNYELLDRKITIEDLMDEILKKQDKKILIECIKKDTAENLYELLKKRNENVYIMTGDDNRYSRQKIIEKTKERSSIILVATQTIEAGVDIDMDIGFKDISFLDGEEQFIGRINRSNKKNNCMVYFFHFDDARIIYKKDKRIGYNLEKEESRKWLEDKSFDLFYNRILKRIQEESESYTENNIEEFRKNCLYINFKKIEDKMKLIKNDTVDIYINYTININGEEISGKKVFDQYREICQDQELSYAERKVKLSQLSEKLNLFTYSIHKNQINLIEGEKILGFYYIENGKKYIVDGRFNRSKYLGKGEELFL